MLKLTGALLVLAVSAPAAQSPRFAFHRDQAVYIAAFHHEHDHAKNAVTRAGGVGDYLSAEQLVRREFDKSGLVRTVDRASDADYVFVVYVHDRTAEGLAIAPDRYSRAKPDLFRGDLDPLRDGAYARYVVGPFKLPTIGRMSTQLVQKFQDGALGTK